MFEYKLLIPFPPTLLDRFGALPANATGTGRACKRGYETRITNPQQQQEVET